RAATIRLAIVQVATIRGETIPVAIILAVTIPVATILGPIPSVTILVAIIPAAIILAATLLAAIIPAAHRPPPATGRSPEGPTRRTHQVAAILAAPRERSRNPVLDLWHGDRKRPSPGTQFLQHRPSRGQPRRSREQRHREVEVAC